MRDTVEVLGIEWDCWLVRDIPKKVEYWVNLSSYRANFDEPAEKIKTSALLKAVRLDYGSDCKTGLELGIPDENGKRGTSKCTTWIKMAKMLILVVRRHPTSNFARSFANGFLCKHLPLRSSTRTVRLNGTFWCLLQDSSLCHAGCSSEAAS